MKTALIFLSLVGLCGSSLAAENKFSLICEWKSGDAGGSNTYHVDTLSKTVDGHSAVITENSIYFIKDAVEHKIDRTSGVLTTKDLKPQVGFRLAGPIIRCEKTASRKF